METLTIDIDITEQPLTNLAECVKTHSSYDISGKKWYDLEEVEEKCLDRLSELYGVDVRALIKEHNL